MKYSILTIFIVCFCISNVSSNTNPWQLEKLTKNQIIELEDVNFAADQTVFSSESKVAINQLKNFLINNKSIVIELQGHTNSIPDHPYCDELSDQRAQSIRNYLIAGGVNPENIKAKGYGKRKPAASNKTDSGRKSNQRVDVKILSL